MKDDEEQHMIRAITTISLVDVDVGQVPILFLK